jgi:hypothetical protein
MVVAGNDQIVGDSREGIGTGKDSIDAGPDPDACWLSSIEKPEARTGEQALNCEMLLP